MPLNLPRRAPKKNLVYTVCFDAPGSESYRFLGKMLASSLLKTYFTGDIVVFRNSPAPLFLVERKGLEEVFLETPEMYGQERAEFAWCWKYRVASLIENPEQYDKILFLDCDSLALRGSIFHEVMEEWQRIDEEEVGRDSGFRDQASWNALLLRAGSAAVTSGSVDEGLNDGAARDGGAPRWKVEPFPAGEVQFPGYLDPHYTSYSKAAVTHNILPDTKEKIEFTFGLYSKPLMRTHSLVRPRGSARLVLRRRRSAWWASFPRSSPHRRPA